MPPVSLPIFCSLSALRFADRVVERDDERSSSVSMSSGSTASGLIVSFVTRKSPLIATVTTPPAGGALDGRVGELFLHAAPSLAASCAVCCHHLGLIHVVVRLLRGSIRGAGRTRSARRRRDARRGLRRRAPGRSATRAALRRRSRRSSIGRPITPSTARSQRVQAALEPFARASESGMRSAIASSSTASTVARPSDARDRRLLALGARAHVRPQRAHFAPAVSAPVAARPAGRGRAARRTGAGAALRARVAAASAAPDGSGAVRPARALAGRRGARPASAAFERGDARGQRVERRVFGLQDEAQQRGLEFEARVARGRAPRRAHRRTGAARARCGPAGRSARAPRPRRHRRPRDRARATPG